MIKIITFCIGVDVLGFPLFHEHRLKFKQSSKYIIGFDPYKSDGSGNMDVFTERNKQNGKIIATYHSRKTPDNEKY